MYQYIRWLGLAICLTVFMAGCEATPIPDVPEEVVATPVIDPPIAEDGEVVGVTATPAEETPAVETPAVEDAAPLQSTSDSPLSQAGKEDDPQGSSATLSPPMQDLVKYRGSNVYGHEYPQFEVWYESESWELHEKYMGRDYTLTHWHFPDCELWLHAGPSGAERVATAQLADREWGIFMIQPTMLSYSIQYETLGFLFGVALPEEFSPDAKSPCQEAAEAVIDTFFIVTETNSD